MKCFYHNDMDGKCAAYWVNHAEEAVDEHGRYFQSVNYDKPFPMDTVADGEMVWIVDFSIEPKEMLALIKKCGLDNIYWIDHHKTAIEKYTDFPHKLQGIRDESKAACELTFEYTTWWSTDTNGATFEEARKSLVAPMFTKLIADRDIWTWQYGQVTKFFYAGAQLLDLRPWSDTWGKLHNEQGFCEEVQKNGALIEQYRARERHISVTYFGYEVIFEGRKCMAVNGPASGDLGQDIKDKGYDIAIVYRHNNNGHWVVSMYSEKVDVGNIARKYGGGGHRGASGFKIEKDPNTLWSRA